MKLVSFHALRTHRGKPPGGVPSLGVPRARQTHRGPFIRPISTFEPSEDRRRGHGRTTEATGTRAERVADRSHRARGYGRRPILASPHPERAPRERADRSGRLESSRAAAGGRSATAPVPQAARRLAVRARATRRKPTGFAGVRSIAGTGRRGRDVTPEIG
jgi:hypothetical protein